jgi:hypothetical protein
VNLFFVESPVFSRQIDGLMDDEGIRELQFALLERPDRGDLIKATGGLRKL